jgi:hypothetical protein
MSSQHPTGLMSLPKPLEYNNQHTLNLSESCPVQPDHLIREGEAVRTLQMPDSSTSIT